MNRLKTAAALLVLTAVIGGAALAGTASRPERAEAAPTAMLGLNSASCVALGSAFGGLTTTDAAANCLTIQRQGGGPGMQEMVKCLRGTDINLDGTHDCLTAADLLQVVPGDFAAMDRDLNQVHEGQFLYVFAFVDDDAPVRFITDKGTFTDFNGTIVGTGLNLYCETGDPVFAPFTGDPDCDGSPATIGDGVVAARIRIDGTVPLGPGHVTAIQEGIGFPMDFTVTGKSETIKLAALFGKDTIQTGATVPSIAVPPPANLPTDCVFGASLSAVLGAIGNEVQTIVIAKALDNDGKEVVGALLTWAGPSMTSGDMAATEMWTLKNAKSPQGGVALGQTPTIDLGGSIGIGFPQFVCGGSEEGDLVLKVMFAPVLDPTADPLSYAKTTIHVVGPAANIALVAEPAVIDCDGVNTSKVTATVTQADGKPVANGLDVNFAVKVLGNNSPLKGDAGGGTASTTVTPLRGAAQTGVPVVVTAGDVQASILVKCTGATPALLAGGAPAGGSQGGAAAPGRPGTISGPDTGTGVPAGRGALSWWPVLGLAAAAAALLTARTALKRR